MKRHARTIGFLLTAALLAGSAHAVDPASDLGQFQTYRGEGMAAFGQNDPAGAMAAFAKAGAILPDSPSILLLKAQVAMKQRKKVDAKAALKDYLKRGYVLDLAKNPDFNQVWDAELNDLLELNESPVGEMRVVSNSPGFILAEGLTQTDDGKEVFVSGVRTGTVTAISAEGARDVVTFRPGVAAYGLTLRDGSLWATTAASRQTQSFDPKAKAVSSKVVVIDPVSGAIGKSFSDTAKSRRFGKLLAGRDDLYVTDSEHGEVLRLAGYDGMLETLVPEGYMDSPGGLAESEDASALIVSDFVSGLYRVDLASGGMTRLTPPVDGALLGISYLARHGRDLIAVQTGFKPNRILRLRMSDDWSEVKAVEVLLRSERLLSQPTQGLVSGDSFVFIAKSQWDNLDARGNPVKPAADPAVIGAISLKR
jgi:hypothetical protein